MNDTDRKPVAASALSVAAISALQHGNKIEAIKITRMERNIGLKEAKDAVEDCVRNTPSLQASLAATQAGTSRTALRWLALLVGVATIAYFLLAKP